MICLGNSLGKAGRNGQEFDCIHTGMHNEAQKELHENRGLV